MPSNTTRLALPYPVPSDAVNVPGDVQNLADRLDQILLSYSAGTLGARPAAGNRGFTYYATDNGLVYFDTGTAWIALNAGVTVGGNPTASAPGDTAQQGSSPVPAASDHRHARTDNYGGSGGISGSSSAIARYDHQHTKTYTVPSTWAVSGPVQVPSGAAGFLPPTFITVPSGETVTLYGLQASLRSGSCTIQLNRNGAAISSLSSSIAVSSTPTSLIQPSSAVTFNSGDQLAPVVNGVTGSPDGLTITAYLSYATTS